MEKYHLLKTDIKHQYKTKIIQVTKDQREELLEQGGKGGKEYSSRHVFRVPMTFKAQSIFTLQHMNLWPIKTKKLT